MDFREISLRATQQGKELIQICTSRDDRIRANGNTRPDRSAVTLPGRYAKPDRAGYLAGMALHGAAD